MKMYKEKIKEFSDLFGGFTEVYFVLTHKKHKREVYFQDTNKAINFLKIKFSPHLKRYGVLKKIVYFLIRIGFLQPFLKKVRLSHKLGDIIFVANQIKCFDLDDKIVTSFPLDEKGYINFIESKEFQKEFGEGGFAPKIFELNKEIPFSKEELLKQYEGGDDEGVFKKLFTFYEIEGIENGITTIHGDFTKEQVLVKDNDYVFTDWNPRKGFTHEDSINFYKSKIQNEKPN